MKAIMTALTAATFIFAANAEEKPSCPPPDQGGKEGRPKPEEMFGRLDANSDGAVTLEEFKAGPRAKKDPERAQEIFGKIDADGNGTVSLDEFKAHRPPQGPGGQGDKAGKGGGDRGRGGRGPGGQGGPGGPAGGGRGQRPI